MKKKVLIMAGYYLPSVKGGGPIRSIKNIVDSLHKEIDFYILAADRDLGDSTTFEYIMTDKWVKVGNANVFYTDIAKLKRKKMKKILESQRFDCLYLNSYFNYRFTTLPLLLSKTQNINIERIVIATRGEFSPGALGLKKYKKRMYINFSKKIRLYNKVLWHATTELEKKDIQNVYGNQIEVIVANNLTANYDKLVYNKDFKKNKGELTVVFISRIHPKKNLKQAIKLLQNIKGNVKFNIYGPIEDSKYWAECKEQIKQLPTNIQVRYHGVINNESVLEVFKKNHIFLFPTLGENFGHVISEALIGGCPIIISNQTPWRKLKEERVGWDIDLKDNEEFIQALNECVNLNQEDYNEFSRRAFNYGLKSSKTKKDLLNTKLLFSLE